MGDRQRVFCCCFGWGSQPSCCRWGGRLQGGPGAGVAPAPPLLPPGASSLPSLPGRALAAGAHGWAHWAAPSWAPGVAGSRGWAPGAALGRGRAPGASPSRGRAPGAPLSRGRAPAPRRLHWALGSCLVELRAKGELARAGSAWRASGGLGGTLLLARLTGALGRWRWAPGALPLARPPGRWQWRRASGAPARAPAFLLAPVCLLSLHTRCKAMGKRKACNTGWRVCVLGPR